MKPRAVFAKAPLLAAALAGAACAGETPSPQTPAAATREERAEQAPRDSSGQPSTAGAEQPASARSGSPSPDSAEAPLPPEAEALSLFGAPLVPPELPPEVRRDREAKLAEARATVAASPDEPEALIWLGRRIAYLGRYREAIEVFTRGAAAHPADARFLRHRGHRHITLRRFDLAEADLARAAQLMAGKPDEVEPDGLPNARNIPTSTLQSNVWYHLGLARYLQGDFEGALAAYGECLAVSGNPDMQVATRHWLYMTLRRLGREEEERQVLAPVRADLDVIENQAYHRLLLMYRGEVSPEELRRAPAGQAEELDPATLGYGLGNWHLYNGRRAEAVRTFREVVAAGPWAAFGAIAAEAELARLGERP